MESFSDGDVEAVESLDDAPKNGMDDSLHETKSSPHSSGHNTSSDIKRGVVKSDSKNENKLSDSGKERKRKTPKTAPGGDTSGFSSVDSIIASQRKLIQDLVQKVEELSGKKLKDTTEEGTKDKEEIIRRQDKFIIHLQREVTELSRIKGVQETKESKTKDRRASFEKKEKECQQLTLEVRELREQLQLARSANDVLVQQKLEDEKREEDLNTLKAEVETLKKKKMVIKKIKATKEKEKALELKASFFEDQLKDTESSLLQSNAHWKAAWEKQGAELQEVKEYLDKTKKQLEEALKLEKTGVSTSSPSSGRTGSSVSKDAYLAVLAELAKSREDRLKLSQYMSKLEVEYVQTKVELVNAVDRCNTLEQQVRSLKELIKKLDTANTLKDWLEQ